MIKKLNSSSINCLVTIVLLISTTIVFTNIGCQKKQSKIKGELKTIDGIVYEDCNGSVAIGKKIYLNKMYSSCFGEGVITVDSTYTNNHGYYKFEYETIIPDNSTSSSYYTLTIPNSLINITNPIGTINLYPNDTIMNAIIHLKFNNSYTAKDTFYYKYLPSASGIIEASTQIYYIVGPLKDTTLQFANLRIGNSTTNNYGQYNCGIFKWGIGKARINSNYTGKDGYFKLTHKPCADIDTFEYNVDPLQ